MRSARLSMIALSFGAVAACGVVAYNHYRPREIPILAPRPLTPAVEFGPDGIVVRVPNRILSSSLGVFDDEFFAFLMFDYLRGIAAPDGYHAWLTYRRAGRSIHYVLRLKAPAGLTTAIPYFYGLSRRAGLEVQAVDWITPAAASRYAAQTDTFNRAYTLESGRKLENLPRREAAAYIRRFIRFKSATDGRIRRGTPPVPRALTRPEAQRLAEDIIAVADFYSLPLDFFLGVGAMENNYHNIRGDLGNAVWKRRPHKGDIVLRRSRRGVLVLNESSGVWQITRETLRHAHKLYRSDTRDYSALPERLRPPAEIDLDHVPPDVLTTYAGLFFRWLLDYFDGDVALAVGAYNGGPGNPNARYEAGVRAVAAHARRVLEHAAVLQGRQAAQMPALVPRP